MNSMYNENPEYAINLMDDDAHVWGIHSSPLVFAYENFMYDVVAHTCSQKNMNKLWYNKLPPDLKPFLKVEALTYFFITLSFEEKLIGLIFLRKQDDYLIKFMLSFCDMICFTE